MRVAVGMEQCWHPVPGGTARSTIDLATALAAVAGIDVIGFSARHSGPPPAPWSPGIPVRAIPLPRRLLYETWHLARWPRVESATGPVDVCHAVGGAIPGSASPLVVTVHDLAFLHHPEMFTRNGNRFFRRALALTRRHAAQVQVPSQATFDDCVSVGIEPHRIRIVPWGASVTSPQAADIEAVRQRFGLPERWIVAVGTREPRKNLDRLVAAWRTLDRPDVELVLVGPEGWGEGPDRPKDSRIKEQVTMTGFVDTATRDALYAGAVASCYPSLFEGFGLPVLESMALGCPVVTSAGTATEELVTGGAGVVVDPRSVDSIRDGLRLVLDDDSARRELAAAGKARSSIYTWEAAAQAAIAGYREVLG